MQITICEDTRQIGIWMTKADSQNAALQKDVKKLISKYNHLHFNVAVYKSGAEDLFGSALALLLQNRLKEEKGHRAE